MVFWSISGQILSLLVMKFQHTDVFIVITYNNWQNLHNKCKHNDAIQFIFPFISETRPSEMKCTTYQSNNTLFLTTSSSLSSGIGGDCTAILEGKLLLTCILRFFFFFFFLWWWSAWRTFFCDLLRRGRRGWWIWGNELLRWPEKVKIRSINATINAVLMIKKNLCNMYFRKTFLYHNKVRHKKLVLNSSRLDGPHITHQVIYLKILKYVFGHKLSSSKEKFHIFKL